MYVCSSYACTWIGGSVLVAPFAVPWIHDTSSEPATGAPAVKSIISVGQSSLMDRQVCVRDLQQRDVDIFRLGSGDQIADDVIGLGPAAGRQIAVHRGGQSGCRVGQ